LSQASIERIRSWNHDRPRRR